MANPLHLPSSRLSEQQSVVEDLLDDDFTPEELSLVQQMLPPERFLRVLSALREAVGRRSCPSKDYYADSFTTPVQQVQPQGLLTQGNPSTSWGQGQAISPWTDRHESYSSDDEGVLTPPRQVATAAEQFQNRLGHVAKPYSRTWSSDDEDECVSSAADAAEEEGVMRPDKAARHAQAEVETQAGYSSDGTDRPPEVEEAWETDQHNATGEAQEQQQQHISPGLQQQQQKSKAALRVGQMHSTDSVHSFLSRLNQPTQHQSPLQSKSSLLPHQARFEMQSQSQSKPAWQSQPLQSRPDPKLGPRQQLPDASSLPGWSGVGGTHSLTPGAAVRQASDRQTYLRGGSSPSEEGSYQGRVVEQADVASSPVQAAVAAVAGRLQSVQQGLASAEGRLAELTGRRPVKRQLEAAEVEDRAADSAMQEGSDATLSEPCGIADIIRRFDSGSAWGSLLHSPKSQSHSMQSLRSQGKSQLSPQRAKDSPRICALRPGQHECHEHAQTGKKAALLPGRDERWDDESALAARQAANVDIPLVKDSSSLEPQHAALGGQRSQSKGNSALPQLKGQGSLVMPQLRGQGSSMRGDQWLPQQWLEPDEQLPEVEAAAASPRDRMHAAMEAVRAAERAVKAAAVLSPRRQG
ncbi:TPA: hypothetical protein ACH3X1_005990 [Trebouxia sp. C0004]